MSGTFTSEINNMKLTYIITPPLNQRRFDLTLRYLIHNVNTELESPLKKTYRSVHREQADECCGEANPVRVRNRETRIFSQTLDVYQTQVDVWPRSHQLALSPQLVAGRLTGSKLNVEMAGITAHSSVCNSSDGRREN